MNPISQSYSVADFDYDFPRALIAQRPAKERSASRLLLLDRSTGSIEHQAFGDFPTLIREGDVLVINTSRVIPARLIGTRDNGRRAEVLLVHVEPDGTWLAMVHPGGKLKAGRRVCFGSDAEAEIVGVLRGGLRRVRFHGLDARSVIERHGAVPLPPYIERPADPEDRERYQTIYARQDGSVAAPTAGLHFTSETLETIERTGATIVETVLHVGPGTFKPVEVEDPSKHTMHAEWYEVSEDAAKAINRAKQAGGRVWAVGTTAARTLETVGSGGSDGDGGSDGSGGTISCDTDSVVSASSGWTDLFIYPPYRFRVIDALLTNFHLPRSTLLMLVAAFAGFDLTMQAYRAAVAERYRLYSYGDAMAII